MHLGRSDVYRAESLDVWPIWGAAIFIYSEAVELFLPRFCVCALNVTMYFRVATLKQERAVSGFFFFVSLCVFSVIRNQIRNFSAGEVYNFLVLASFCRCFFF